MVSSDLSDTVKFIYKSDTISENDFSFSFSQNVGPQLGETFTEHLWAIASEINERTFNPVRISSIVFKGGKVDFISKTGRLDNGNYALDSVIVSYYNGSTGSYCRLKSFKLLTNRLFL